MTSISVQFLKQTSNTKVLQKTKLYDYPVNLYLIYLFLSSGMRFLRGAQKIYQFIGRKPLQHLAANDKLTSGKR